MSGSQLVVLCANILICLKECCQLPIVGDKIEKVTLNIPAARKDKEAPIQGPFFIVVLMVKKRPIMN